MTGKIIAAGITQRVAVNADFQVFHPLMLVGFDQAPLLGVATRESSRIHLRTPQAVLVISELVNRGKVRTMIVLTCFREACTQAGVVFRIIIVEIRKLEGLPSL